MSWRVAKIWRAGRFSLSESDLFEKKRVIVTQYTQILRRHATFRTVLQKTRKPMFALREFERGIEMS